MQRWGHIDFLINNAGVGSPKPLHETDDESLDYFLGLMLRAPFRLARDVIPHMQPGSAIINVTSTFAVVGGLRGGAYSAAKGGLTSLTMHIACQYGATGNPVQRSGTGGDADADGGAAAGGRAVPEDQHRDDTAPAAGQGRRHRKHGRVPVLRGRQLHQRPDDRRRRRLEFDEVPVGLRAELGMGRPLNLFVLLDQAAARFGDRGAVYHGERQLHTWAELRGRALRLAGSLRQLGPGARIAVASENRPEIIELMFAVWAAECVYLPINYKLHPREMQQILDDAGAALVFASPKIAAELTPVTDVPVEVIGGRCVRIAAQRRAGGSAVHRPGRIGLAVLHQRNHRPVQGRDAVAPQPDGDDGRPSRGFRCARRELQPGARRADVARFGSLHSALRAARARVR